jgi:hypothetical protein
MESIEEVCPICLEEYEEDCVVLSCSHSFHKKCINKAIYQFDNEDTLRFKLNKCPMCRNHLSCNDKRLTITGEQFWRVLQNILLSEIENKPELMLTVYDAYEQVHDLSDEKYIVTADDIYNTIISWREYEKTYVDLEVGYNHALIRQYSDILDVCKRHFGFV